MPTRFSARRSSANESRDPINWELRKPTSVEEEGTLKLRDSRQQMLCPWAESDEHEMKWDKSSFEVMQREVIDISEV